MRYGLLALGTAGCIGLTHVWLAPAYHHAALDDDARAAIEIRCQGRDGRATRQCRELHERLYLAGTLDPERTLRAHCTLLHTLEWGARPPPPPLLCVERYGGWQRG